MLVLPHSSQLGDGNVRGAEALARLYEDTDRRLRQFRLPDHDALKQRERLIGTPMAHTELIRRVTKLNPRVWAEDSINFPENWGFYTTDQHGAKTFIVAAAKGFLPEHSWIEADRADLATKEHRGWRTVLTRLLDAKALNWSQVTEAFGDTNSTARNLRWRKNTARHRTK